MKMQASVSNLDAVAERLDEPWNKLDEALKLIEVKDYWLNRIMAYCVGEPQERTISEMVRLALDGRMQS
jgi:hypothetical protein